MYLPASGHDWRTLTLYMLGLDNLEIFMTGVRIEETYDRRQPKLQWKTRLGLEFDWYAVFFQTTIGPAHFAHHFFPAETIPLD